MPDVKTCTKCKHEKPLTEFAKSQVHPGGLNCHCSDCRRPSQVRSAFRTRCDRMGVSATWYIKTYKKQDGLCAVCGQPETKKDYRLRTNRPNLLCIDHDHTTGAVRELLCDRCNRVLGFADDDPAILKAAAKYLEKHLANQR